MNGGFSAESLSSIFHSRSSASNSTLSGILLRLHPPGFCFLTDFEVASLYRKRGLLIQLFAPLAKGVAKPRHLRSELRQLQLFPDLARVLHIFALGQRYGWKRLFENRVAEHRRFVGGAGIRHHVGALGLVLVEKRRRMALFHSGKDLHVLVRLHAVTHRPENRRF